MNSRTEYATALEPELPRIVLVVDDSPDTLSLLNEALEQAGYTVLIALEGKQALSIAGRMKPDIILLDALMPHLDGFSACRQLKADPRLADIPVIFMTGLSDTDHIVTGLQAGGVDYLTKPINPDELLARMRVHLENAHLTHSAHSALDSTGQHLFTVDALGHTIWATPQVQQLLNRASTDQHWQRSALPVQLTQWLRHRPQPGQTLTLLAGETPPRALDFQLQVRMVEHTTGRQTLLRLIDGSAPDGAEKLRARLPLTERESEVLYWLGNGKTNREIGQILATSPRTVNKHLEQVFRKLDVDNRTSAAAIAIRLLARD